ncbi:PadR family transcriptional regulator [Rhizobium bangladeshense]|uniref:PadR family transcriptional regulator n=1 Tax=Rhizobium bangladeshense TaxID=1138189 RepID=UPI0009ED544A
MVNTVRLTTQTVNVIKAIVNRPGGVSGAEISRDTELASGSLYPILMRLEKAGWLSSEWEAGDPAKLGRPRRRYYRVTALGQREVNAVRDALAPTFGEAAWTAS